MPPFTPHSPVGTQKTERCPICAKSITSGEARTKNTCGAWRCNRIYRQKQLARRRQKNEQLQQQYDRRLAQATEVRDASAKVDGIEVPDSYLTIMVPVNKNRLVPLPPRRRSQFAKKLIRLVESALNRPAAKLATDLCPDEEQSWTLPILGLVCAICQGRCCLKGGTHAHLDIDTVCRYLQEHPEARFRDVVAAYCRLLGRKTYEGSCVFHTAVGCRLPRQMRSAACRTTVCSGLIELRDRAERYGQTRFFISAMDKYKVVRSKFVEGDSRYGEI